MTSITIFLQNRTFGYAEYDILKSINSHIKELVMCTLMQKDALIERVASVQALIARKIPRTGKRTTDQNRIVEVRRLLYDSLPEVICPRFNGQLSG